MYTEIMNKEEKKKKIKTLFDQVNDYFIKEYFDVDSDNDLDVKIEVLEDLLAGKKPYEIARYDDVLEKYPEHEQFVHGDIQDLLNKL